MTHMTKLQAQRLAEFVHLARPAWNVAGILSALEQAAPTADVWDVARALLNIAEDDSVKTPGMLTRPGSHWRKPDGAAMPRRGDHNVPCPDHPTEHDSPCPNPPEPIDPAVIASLAAQARAAIAAKPYTPRLPGQTKEATDA